MKRIIIAALAIACSAPVLADPLPYRSRGGRGCPSGYVGSGDYCRPSSPDARDAIPRRSGESCPSGWVGSGSACVRSR